MRNNGLFQGYHNQSLFDRKAVYEKNAEPIKAMLEAKYGIQLDESNPRHAKKLEWMTMLQEANTIQTKGARSLFENNGYGNQIAGHQPGMGAVSLPGVHTPGGNVKTASGNQFGSGDQVKHLTAAAMHIAAATIAFELLPVIPLESTQVMTTFYETIYGGADVTDTEKNPQYISIPMSFFRAIDANTTNLLGGGNALAQDALVPLVENQVVILTANGALANQLVGGGDGLELRFKGNHALTNDYRFQVVGTVEIDDATTGAFSRKDDTTVATFLTSQAVATDGFVLTIEDPANAGQALVLDADTVLLGSATNAVAPEVKLPETAYSPILGAGNRDGFTNAAMPREVAELGTEQQVGLRTMSISDEVGERTILAGITRQQQRDLQRSNYDAFELVMDAAKTQLMQEVNDEILDMMFRYGVEHHKNILEGTGLQLNLFVADAANAGQTIAQMSTSSAKTFKFEDIQGNDVSALFGTVPNFRQSNLADGYVDQIRMIKSRIGLVADVIAKRTRSAQADFIVASTGLCSALVDAKDNTKAPVENTLVANTAAYKGTLKGLDVYCDPRMSIADNRILVGRRGTETDSGLKYYVYDLLNSMDIIAESSMSPRGLVTMSYLLFAQGFHPELNYLTFIAQPETGTWI